jgi:hypothetical protein
MLDAALERCDQIERVKGRAIATEPIEVEGFFWPYRNPTVTFGLYEIEGAALAETGLLTLAFTAPIPH